MLEPPRRPWATHLFLSSIDDWRSTKGSLLHRGRRAGRELGDGGGCEGGDVHQDRGGENESLHHGGVVSYSGGWSTRGSLLHRGRRAGRGARRWWWVRVRLKRHRCIENECLQRPVAVQVRSARIEVLRVLGLSVNPAEFLENFQNQNKHRLPRCLQVICALVYELVLQCRKAMRAKTNREFERGASADLWRHSLSRIPSSFGRLVYLSSLRNNNSGQYEHHGLALMFGESETHDTLLESHRRTFAEWLNYGLEQQKADLDFYLSSLSIHGKTLVATWLRLAPYRNFVPSNVRAAERQLYLTDLETLLDLLRNVYGVSAADLDS